MYWNIAYAAEFEAGNFAVAREYYRRLMNEYPQDVRIFGVRKALERMDAIEAALREGRNPAPNLLGDMLSPICANLRHLWSLQLSLVDLRGASREPMRRFLSTWQSRLPWIVIIAIFCWAVVTIAFAGVSRRREMW